MKKLKVLLMMFLFMLAPMHLLADIVIDNSPLIINVGDEVEFTVNVSKMGGRFDITSSDVSVATVTSPLFDNKNAVENKKIENIDNGIKILIENSTDKDISETIIIKGIKKGTATITIKAVDMDENTNEGATSFSENINVLVGSKTYNIEFNENGGDIWTDASCLSSKYIFNSSKCIKIVTEGQPYGELPVPTNGEYTFMGWYTDTIGGKKITADSLVAEDLIVYAHWEKISRVATYKLVIVSSLSLIIIILIYIIIKRKNSRNY